MKVWRALLIIIAVVCIGVALSYPILHRVEEDSNDSEMETLSSMRMRVLEDMSSEASGAPSNGDAGDEPSGDAPHQEPPEGGAPDAAAVQDDSRTQAPEGMGPTDFVTLQPEGEMPRVEDVPADNAETASAQAGDSWQQVSGGEEQPAAVGTQVPADGASQGVQPADGEVPAQTENNVESGAQPANGAGEAQALPEGAQPTQTAPDAAGEVSGITTATTARAPEELDIMDLLLDDAMFTPTPAPVVTPTPTPTPEPSPTPDRSIRTDALPYPDKEKVELDESKILPELREIYEINNDLVGWIYIEGTVVDYPVVQCQDSDYYLKHDFNGAENNNGQIILDTKCDPYTPSYNLIISGHHMKSGKMFGSMGDFAKQSYWAKHKIVEFDTLMERKQYVIFAAFYSADYDEDETGFRYNADIQYRKEAEKWLREVRDNQLYDTGVDVDFGDEFITLTTCNRSRHRNGRFVVVCRRIREGEIIE